MREIPYPMYVICIYSVSVVWFIFYARFLSLAFGMANFKGFDANEKLYKQFDKTKKKNSFNARKKTGRVCVCV